MDTELSASEATFTPPGSVPPVETAAELPVEELQLQDLDFHYLDKWQLANPEQLLQRVDWADQQDPPEDLAADTNLLGLYRRGRRSSPRRFGGNRARTCCSGASVYSKQKIQQLPHLVLAQSLQLDQVERPPALPELP